MAVGVIKDEGCDELFTCIVFLVRSCRRRDLHQGNGNVEYLIQEIDPYRHSIFIDRSEFLENRWPLEKWHPFMAGYSSCPNEVVRGKISRVLVLIPFY